MNYEEYQEALLANQAAMSETKDKEAETHRALTTEYRQIQAQLKQQYLDTLKLQEQLYQQRVRNNREYWRAERSRLYREIHLKVALWKRENGILPPPLHRDGGTKAGKGGEQ